MEKIEAETPLPYERQDGDVIFWKGEQRFRTDAVTGKQVLNTWCCDFSILDFTKSRELLAQGIAAGTIVEIAH